MGELFFREASVCKLFQAEASVCSAPKTVYTFLHYGSFHIAEIVYMSPNGTMILSCLMLNLVQALLSVK
jgi:hypothetical protein